MCVFCTTVVRNYNLDDWLFESIFGMRVQLYNVRTRTTGFYCQININRRSSQKLYYDFGVQSFNPIIPHTIMHLCLLIISSSAPENFRFPDRNLQWRKKGYIIMADRVQNVYETCTKVKYNFKNRCS